MAAGQLVLKAERDFCVSSPARYAFSEESVNEEEQSPLSSVTIYDGGPALPKCNLRNKASSSRSVMQDPKFLKDGQAMWFCCPRRSIVPMVGPGLCAPQRQHLECNQKTGGGYVCALKLLQRSTAREEPCTKVFKANSFCSSFHYPEQPEGKTQFTGLRDARIMVFR